MEAAENLVEFMLNCCFFWRNSTKDFFLFFFVTTDLSSKSFSFFVNKPMAGKSTPPVTRNQNRTATHGQVASLITMVTELKAQLSHSEECITALGSKVEVLISSNNKIERELSDVHELNKSLTAELEKLFELSKQNTNNTNSIVHNDKEKPSDVIDNGPNTSGVSGNNNNNNNAASTHNVTNKNSDSSSTDAIATADDNDISRKRGVGETREENCSNNNNSTVNSDNATVESIRDVQPLRAAAKRTHIFVTNCDPATSEDKMAKFISSKLNGRPVVAKRLVPPGRAVNTLNYVSFRVSLPADCEQAVIDPGFWPDKDISARIFENRSKNRRTSQQLSV